jgi:hypothetical protein
MKKLASALVLVCVVGIVAILASFPPHASSSSVASTLTGYAWSSNIGWICFYDTTTPSNCGNATVNINSDNTLSGYAWSNNAGWISFTASETGSCGSGATYNPATGGLSGWAKALNGVDSDGCISLSGTAQDSSPYGVTFTGGVASGYAWGSDVLGWISFHGSTYGVILSSVVSSPSITAGSFTANPTRVRAGTPTSVKFYYTVTNPPAGGCSITGTGGFTSIPLTLAQVIVGSYTTSETISQNTAITLTCGVATATADLGLIPSFQEI